MEFTKKSSGEKRVSIILKEEKKTDLDILLRSYGLINFPVQVQDSSVNFSQSQSAIIFVSEEVNLAGLNIRKHVESGRQLYYPRTKIRNVLKSPSPVYHALLPHITFTGEQVEPVWVNEAGRAAIAWYKGQNTKTLLIGLDVEEEIIRHRQGDSAKVEQSKYKGGYGFDYERANYLFEDQILPQYRTQPWADHLGFFLAETFSRLSGYPLIDPLPGGAKGAVILTGDDDQALLEKYAEQLRIVGDLSITYLLVPQTRHTSETLAQLPPNVEIGLHPDALEQPDEYDRLCAEQAAQIRQLSGKPIRTLRNHGYLNRGYLGHLKAWEDNGIALDVNYTSAEGTALNGSFLPMRVRRPDGMWSDHYSLLTAFGDGMIFALQLTEDQAVQKIGQLARQIEANYPGLLVFNFHPQNIDSTRQLHQAVLGLARRFGWIALGLETYLDWLKMLESISIKHIDNTWVLTSTQSVKNLVLRYPVAGGWRIKTLTPWSGQVELIADAVIKNTFIGGLKRKNNK